MKYLSLVITLIITLSCGSSDPVVGTDSANFMRGTLYGTSPNAEVVLYEKVVYTNVVSLAKIMNDTGVLSPIDTTYTDENGNFDFIVTKSGTYSLRIKSIEDSVVFFRHNINYVASYGLELDSIIKPTVENIDTVKYEIIDDKYDQNRSKYGLNVFVNSNFHFVTFQIVLNGYKDISIEDEKFFIYIQDLDSVIQLDLNEVVKINNVKSDSLIIDILDKNDDFDNGADDSNNIIMKDLTVRMYKDAVFNFHFDTPKHDEPVKKPDNIFIHDFE